MQRLIKYTAALLSLILPLFSFLACSDTDKEENALYTEVVGSAGEYDILYDELRFVTLTYRKILDATYGDGIDDNGTIWDREESAKRYRGELEKKVQAMLEENYRVLAACSVYGIGRDVLEGEEIQQQVSLQYKNAVASFSSEEAFLADMDGNFMTERLYKLYLARDFMKYKLRDAVLQDKDSEVIKDQESFYKWLNNGNCVYVQHILLRNDEGEDKEANRRIAEEVSATLKKGEQTIDAFVGSAFFNEDLTNVSPYYLIQGLYDPALTDAGLRLYSDGDASDVIETEEGFYVLQRIEAPKGDLEGRLADLYDTYLWTMIGETSTEVGNTDVILNDYGKSLDLVTLK
ncbi:MAG: hypothetical protein E7643_00545 [Ruminococcaceae bacterium]|nr:hypothetical protein [Oscillospiraceae bacterium]